MTAALEATQVRLAKEQPRQAPRRGVAPWSATGRLAERIALELIAHPDCAGVRFNVSYTESLTIRSALCLRLERMRPGWTVTVYRTEQGDYFAGMVRKQEARDE